MMDILEILGLVLLNSIITMLITGFILNKTLKQLVSYYYDDKLEFSKRIVFIESVIGKDKIEKQIRENKI